MPKVQPKSDMLPNRTEHSAEFFGRTFPRILQPNFGPCLAHNTMTTMQYETKTHKIHTNKST